MTLAIAFKEVFNQLDLNLLGVTAMLVFFASFVAMAVWISLRPREEIRHWSSLPLTDDATQAPVTSPAEEAR